MIWTETQELLSGNIDEWQQLCAFILCSFRTRTRIRVSFVAGKKKTAIALVMEPLHEWSFKPKKLELEEDFYFDYGAEEITDYQDPSELLAALKQKEEEVILAAQLGNALLLENRQLKEKSDKLHEQFTDRLEVRGNKNRFLYIFSMRFKQDLINQRGIISKMCCVKSLRFRWAGGWDNECSQLGGKCLMFQRQR